MKQSMLSVAITFALMAHVNVSQAADKPTAASAQYGEATPFGQQKLPIVYLGSGWFVDQVRASFASEKKLDQSASRQVVIVESGRQDVDFVTNLLAKGNVVISVGNADVDSVKTAMVRLEDLANGTNTNLSEFDSNQPRLLFSDAAASEADKESLPLKEGIVTAFFHSSEQSHYYYTNEQDLTLAVSEAIQWANKIVAKAPELASAKSDGWTTVATIEHNYNCRLGASGQFHVGRFNLISTFQRNPANSARDVWAVKYRQEMIPVSGMGPLGHENRFNSYLVTKANVIKREGVHQLLDHQPFTTTSASVANVVLSATSGGFSLTRNWSYSIPDIRIFNYGNVAWEKAHWEHDLNQERAIGSTTAVMEPGMIVSTPQNVGLLHKIGEEFRPTWVTRSFRGGWSNMSCDYRFNGGF